LFQNRNYVRVFSAGLGSVAGSGIAGVCIIWIVYANTGSAWDVAYLVIAELLAAIAFSTLGGTLVDRYNRRRLMIVSDGARAGAMATAVGVLAVGGFDLPILLAAGAVVGAFTVVFNPAEQALIPVLVPTGQVADANGLVRSSRSTLQFVGVSLGGVLIVAVGPLWGLVANAATFAASAAILSGMAVPELLAAPGSAAEKPGYFAEIAEGFRWLWTARAFFQLTLSALVFNFCSTIIATFLVFYSGRVLLGSALVYAGLLAALVAGIGVGSLLVGRLGAARYAGKAWVVPYGLASGIVALPLALFPSVPLAVTALFVIGVFSGFAGTAWLTAAQILVPTGMQGRYFGIDQLGSVAIIPLGELMGALWIGLYDVRNTYAIAAVIWIVAGAIFLAPRALWNLGVGTSDPDVTPHTDGAGAGTPESPEGSRGA